MSADKSGPFTVKWDRATVLDLIGNIKLLKDQGQLNYLDLIKACLLPKHYSEGALGSAQQRFSRWINHAGEGDKWRNIKEVQFRKLAAYVFRLRHEGTSKSEGHGLIDAMFFGMMSWLSADDDTFFDLRETFPAEYTIYRHSLSAPGFVAVGALSIKVDAASGAVRTHERYRIPGQGTGTSFEMNGYLARKHGRYYIFSLHDDGRDALIQYSYVNSVSRRGGAGVDGLDVMRMRGVVSDIQEHDFYSCRFVCIRERPKRLGLVKLQGLSATIRRELQGPPEIVVGPDEKIGYVVAL